MVRIDLAVDRSRTYRVGDALPCRVALTDPDGRTIRGARAGLVQRHSYAWDEYTFGRQQTHDRYTTVETWLSELELLEGQTLPAGFWHEWTPRLPIPETITPPCEGQHVTIRHLVKVTIDIPGAADATEEAGLRIVVPPRVPGQPGAYGETDDPGFVALELQLPGLTIAEGDRLQGQLVAEPYREVRVRQVRLRLVGDVAVARGISARRQTIVLAETPIAQETVFPELTATRVDFELTIPTILCPTHLTDATRADWRLEAILDRPWARDVVLAQPIQTFNGR